MPGASRRRCRSGPYWPALEIFRDERRKTGQPEDVSCPLIRECFVGRDAAHAATASRGPLLFKYRYASGGEGETAGSDFDAAFDDFAKRDNRTLSREDSRFERARSDICPPATVQIRWQGADGRTSITGRGNTTAISSPLKLDVALRSQRARSARRQRAARGLPRSHANRWLSRLRTQRNGIDTGFADMKRNVGLDPTAPARAHRREREFRWRPRSESSGASARQSAVAGTDIVTNDGMTVGRSTARPPQALPHAQTTRS